MKQDQIVIYQTEDGQTQIDVRLENETVWLTQTQMAQLFKSSRTNVLEHIQHIYEDEELEKEATCGERGNLSEFPTGSSGGQAYG